MRSPIGLRPGASCSKKPAVRSRKAAGLPDVRRGFSISGRASFTPATRRVIINGFGRNLRTPISLRNFCASLLAPSTDTTSSDGIIRSGERFPKVKMAFWQEFAGVLGKCANRYIQTRSTIVTFITRNHESAHFYRSG